MGIIRREKFGQAPSWIDVIVFFSPLSYLVFFFRFYTLLSPFHLSHHLTVTVQYSILILNVSWEGRWGWGAPGLILMLHTSALPELSCSI